MSSLTVISWRFKMIYWRVYQSVKPTVATTNGETLQQILPHRGALLTNFIRHDYLLHGDDKSLNRASELLGEIQSSQNLPTRVEKH